MTPEEMLEDFENHVERLVLGYKQSARDREQFVRLAGTTDTPLWCPNPEDVRAVLNAIDAVNQGPASAPETEAD